MHASLDMHYVETEPTPTVGDFASYDWHTYHAPLYESHLIQTETSYLPEHVDKPVEKKPAEPKPAATQ